MTKLETLQKAVVDTAAAHDAAYKAWEDAWDTDDADAYDVTRYAANANYGRAKEKLAAYLKEQDNE